MVDKMTYKFVAPTNMSIRSGSNVAAGKIGQLDANEPALGDNLFIVTVPSTNALVGDKWLQIITPHAGWVAAVHMGRSYGTLTVEDTAPPADPPLPSGITPVSITIYYSDGTSGVWKLVK